MILLWLFIGIGIPTMGWNNSCKIPIYNLSHLFLDLRSAKFSVKVWPGCHGISITKVTCWDVMMNHWTLKKSWKSSNHQTTKTLFEAQSWMSFLELDIQTESSFSTIWSVFQKIAWGDLLKPQTALHLGDDGNSQTFLGSLSLHSVACSHQHVTGQNWLAIGVSQEWHFLAPPSTLQQWIICSFLWRVQFLWRGEGCPKGQIAFIRWFFFKAQNGIFPGWCFLFVRLPIGKKESFVTPQTVPWSCNLNQRKKLKKKWPKITNVTKTISGV